MSPKKIRRLRYKLAAELRYCFPRTDQVTIGKAVNLIVLLLLRETFNLVNSEHEADCACWHCVMSLNADVAQHAAMLRVAREAADEHD